MTIASRGREPSRLPAGEAAAHELTHERFGGVVKILGAEPNNAGAASLVSGPHRVPCCT